MSLIASFRTLWLPVLVAALLIAAQPGCRDAEAPATTPPVSITLPVEDLYAVSLGDDRLAIAVGYFGTILRSLDGGGAWTAQASGVRVPLFDVSMANGREGWAVGPLGLILRTEDAGESWHPQGIGIPAHLLSIEAIDGQRAVAVGTAGTRLETRDGGAHWIDRSESGSATQNDLHSVHCRQGDTISCWSVGVDGTILRSLDGGAVWQESSIVADAVPPEIGFREGQSDLSAEDLEALRHFGRIMREHEATEIAIKSMTSAAEVARLGRAEDPVPLFDVLDARAQEIRTILEEEGIASERLILLGEPPWDFEDYLDDDPEFLERYLRARTGASPGATMEPRTVPTLFGVTALDAERIVATGTAGVALYSEDAGATWRRGDVDREGNLFSLAAVEGFAMAVGDGGRLRISDDGGRSWSVMTEGDVPPGSGFLRDIAFAPDAQTGFIVGEQGQILRSRDGGRVWQPVSPASLP